MRGIWRSWCAVATAMVGLADLAVGIQVDWNDQSSVKNAASTIAYDMMTFYTGNQSGIYNVPGMLPAAPAYYWWEAGAMWGALIDYWHITGDTSYNDATQQGLLFQVGPDQDYMPNNESKQLGNDDQAFWGFAAMTAAEYNFPDPPENEPQWLALAQAVFNEFVVRWDTLSCAGGLKWQIFPFNTGYDYKNAIANGGMFNLASRLARYTGNETYADWANEVYDWVERIGLIDQNYYVYDGTDDRAVDDSGKVQNCTSINHLQYSYNPGIWMQGAANMYSYTNGTNAASLWQSRTQGFLDGALQYFRDPKTGVFVEMACEPLNPMTCDTDMLTFKGILVRSMAASAQLAPFLADTVQRVVATQAAAAAQQCSGGANRRMCGFKWNSLAQWDGTSGAGQQMSALQAVVNTLIAGSPGPVTNMTGGTSLGNPNAGNTNPGALNLAAPLVATAKDRAGAGVVTGLVLLSASMAMCWMLMD